MPLKKILLVHNYYQQWGGEDVVFEMECELLRQKGHDVETLTFHNDDIDSTFSKIQAGLGLFYNTESAKRLEETINLFKPDIIHIHNFFPIASPAVLKVAKRFDIPVIMTLHNFRLVCSGALLFREGKPCEECLTEVFPLAGIRNACYRDSVLQSAGLTCMTSLHKVLGTWRDNVNRYIALNPFAKKKIMDSSLSLNLDQVAVKPNFIFDPFGSTPPNIEDFKGDKKEEFILFVGRLSFEKGVETLLAAYDTDLALPMLKVIGTGPLEAKVKVYADTYANIEYLGFQDKTFIYDVVKRAKAVVLPAVWYENFPMTIIEALACGTPVITSEIGALPGIIEDNKNGFLAAPGSPNELRGKILQLGQVDYPELCYNARKCYLENYTPERNYEQLLEIYRSAVTSTC